jgi:hypothetical protein
MASLSAGSSLAQGLYNQSFGSASKRFKGEDSEGIGGAPISNAATQAFADAQNKDYMKSVGPTVEGVANAFSAKAQAMSNVNSAYLNAFAQMAAPKQQGSGGDGILGAAIGAAGSILGGPTGGVAAKGLSKVFNFG